MTEKLGAVLRRLFHWRKCSCVSTKTKLLSESFVSFVWGCHVGFWCHPTWPPGAILYGPYNVYIILEILNFQLLRQIMTRKPKIGSLTNMTELLVYLVSWWRDATWKPIIISLQLLLSCCVYRNCSRDPVKKKRRRKKQKARTGFEPAIFG